MREGTATNPASPATPALVRLPPRPTRLIGREREVAALRELFLRDDVRLVTITGPPGVGKTRLAVEVGASMTDAFADGVVFVDLSAIRNPSHVSYAIVQALSIEDETDPQEPLPPVWLSDFLLTRRMALILDNFEQVIEAAPMLGDLLGDCVGLKVLATSRAPLQVLWEREFPITPLLVANRSSKLPGTSSAIQLFAERVAAVRPSFVLDEDASRIAHLICTRVDGLPLAIELVAGHARHFPLPILVEQLDRGLDVLSGGGKDRPPRHHDLRKAIAWSYDLLPLELQVLFRRLTVFAGTFGIEAAEAICAYDISLDIYTALEALADRNLLRPYSSGKDVRFFLLQTLREFGQKALESAGEADSIRHRHLMHVVRVAEQAWDGLNGRDQLDWLVRLDLEYDNIREAVVWALSHERTEEVVQIAASLRSFWWLRGHLHEARSWIEEVLDSASGLPPVIAARGLFIAGYLAWREYDLRASKLYFDRALQLSLETHDMTGTADGLLGVGLASSMEGNQAAAEGHFRDALAVCRSLQDTHRTAVVLARLGWILAGLARFTEAQEVLQEARTLGTERGDRRTVAMSLNGLGAVAAYQDDLEGAKAHFVKSLHEYEQLGSSLGTVGALNNLGTIALFLYHFDEAREYLSRSQETSVSIYGRRNPHVLTNLGIADEIEGAFHQAAAFYRDSRNVDDEAGIPVSPSYIEEAAGVAVGLGDAQKAALLMGAAEAHRIRKSSADTVFERKVRELRIQRILKSMQKAQFDASVAQGRLMSFEDALRIADSVVRESSVNRVGPMTVPSRTVSPLSRREGQVAGLISEGRSNRDIAKRLFISERTADTHVQHILNKLGFNSRTQIAAWAMQHGLASPTT